MADLREEVDELVAQAKQVEVALRESLDALAEKAKAVGADATPRSTTIGGELHRRRPICARSSKACAAEVPESSLSFDVYKDKAGEWRWKLVAKNGRTIADSAEGYENYTDLQSAVSLIKSAAPTARIKVKMG